MITQTRFTVVQLLYSPVRLAAQIQESSYFFRYFVSNFQTLATAFMTVILFNRLPCVMCMWMGYDTISISTANSLTVFACHVTQHTNDMIKTLDFPKHILWRRKLNIGSLSLSFPTSELSTWKMDKSMPVVMSFRTIISYEFALTPSVNHKFWNGQYNGKVFNCD